MSSARLVEALRGRVWIFFDLYGTLVRPRGGAEEVYRRALADLGLTPGPALLREGIRAATDAYWIRRSACRTEPDVRRVQVEMAAALIEHVAPGRGREERRALAGRLAPVIGRMRHWYEPYEDARPALERLRAGGWRLGVISNWDATAFQLLRELGLREFFQVLAVSVPDGVEKPDPAIFRLALRRAGARPEEAVMVGDSYEDDVLPARDLGLLALHLTRRGRPGGRPDAGGLSVPGEAGAPPDGVVAISSLLELAPEPPP